jgi:membrane fusion protein, heavy metal efflux system
MMDHPSPAPLPATRSLPPGTQYRLLGKALLAGLALLLLLAFLHRLVAKPSLEPAPPPDGTFRPTVEQRAALTIALVGYREAMDETAASGTIALDEDRSTPVLMPYSGQVTQVLIEAGQQVARGQALLKIRTGDFVDARNTLFAAAGARAAAFSQLRVAEANAKRQEEIYKTAGGALKDQQQAQNDLVTARSAARSADAALGAARDKLTILGKSPLEIARLEHVDEVSGIHAETTLHAPIAGIVASRAVSVGQYVGAGGDKPVFTIADPTHVWLVAQIAESDAARVLVGDPVEVRTPAFPGRIFHAAIDNVGAALDPVTHRLPVRASIPNPDLALKPEMFASFTIRRPDPTRAILVPAGAVIHEGDSARVWVLRPDGLLVARSVCATKSGDGMVEIASGLAPGERIVTAGAIFVNEAGLGE